MRFILPCMFIFLLLIAGMSSAQVLFSEDFANGVLHNTWYPGFNGDSMEVEFMTGNPSGDNWVGMLANVLSGGGVGQTFSGDMTWTDFYYEAQVYIPVTLGYYYGIEFRIDSTGVTNAYNFVTKFNTASPKIRFRSRITATPTVIRDWTAAEIPGGVPTVDGWHKMAVKAVGNQFWLFWDDQELPGCPYTDNTFSSGWIGAYVWDMFGSDSLYIDDITVLDVASSIEDPRSGIMSDYVLNQNYPNPFNPSTTLSFDLPRQETVQLAIFNSLGQKVRTLLNSSFSAGNHQVSWDSRNDLGELVPAGIYYYTLKAGNYQATRKMLLLK